MAKQFVGVFLEDLVEVCCHYGTGVHDGITEGLCLVFLVRFDPTGVQAKGGVFALYPLDLAEHLTWVYRQFTVRMDFCLGNGHPHQGDAINIGHQVEVVANMDRRHQEAQIL